MNTGNHAGILGRSFLEKFGAVIDTKSNKMSLSLPSQCSTMDFNISAVSNRLPTTSEAILIEDQVFPPFTKALIQVSPKDKAFSHDQALVEKDPRADQFGLSIGRCLVRGNESSMPCLVLNPTEQQIILEKGTSIA